MKIQEVTSPGGIRAWLVEEHRVPLMALRFAFEGGSAQDASGKEGLANLLTALMDEGAGDLPSHEFQERMERIAMRMGFDDTRDAIYGTVQTLTAHRDTAVELLRLAVNEPRFDPEPVERLKAELVSSLRAAAKNPDAIANREWYAAAFPGHPYGRPPSGTEASLQSIGRDDLAAWHRRVFARDTLKLVAVGDIDAEGLGALLDRVFGALPAKSELAPVPAAAPMPRARQRVIDLDVPQSVVHFGLDGLARSDPDFVPAYVMNEILGGGGFSSRLMIEVREKRGLSYGTYTYLMPFRSGHAFAGGVKTRNEAVAESIAVIRGEIRRMADDGPSEAELADAKAYLTGSFALRLDTSAKIASVLLGFLYDGLGIDYVDRRNALIEAVSAEDIRRVARRLLKADDLLITVVGRPVGLADQG